MIFYILTQIPGDSKKSRLCTRKEAAPGSHAALHSGKGPPGGLPAGLSCVKGDDKIE